MHRTIAVLCLAGAALAAVGPAFAADPPVTTPTEAGLNAIQSLMVAAVAVAVPIVMKGIKWLIPVMPKALVPILAVAIGPGIEYLVALIAGQQWSGVLGIAGGAAGIALREISDQGLKAIKGEGGTVKCHPIVPVLILGLLLAACAGSVDPGGTGTGTTTQPAPPPKTPEQIEAERAETCRRLILGLTTARNTAVGLIVVSAKSDKAADKKILLAQLAYTTAIAATQVYGCDVPAPLLDALPQRPQTVDAPAAAK